MSAQTRLPDLPPRAKELDDFELLPAAVRPTQFRVLEQNGNLLVTKHYDYGQTPSGKHRQICELLVKYGNSPDAPGSMTVALIWGKTGTHRAIETYEPHGHTKQLPCDSRHVQRWIFDWFESAR